MASRTYAWSKTVILFAGLTLFTSQALAQEPDQTAEDKEKQREEKLAKVSAIVGTKMAPEIEKMYNQKHHQFDSLYNHKFGFHINGPRNDAFAEVLRLKPKVVKTLDFSVEVMKHFRREIPDLCWILASSILSSRKAGFTRMSVKMAKTRSTSSLSIEETNPPEFCPM